MIDTAIATGLAAAIIQVRALHASTSGSVNSLQASVNQAGNATDVKNAVDLYLAVLTELQKRGVQGTGTTSP